MGKRRTTIHISAEALDGASEAGVKNFSGYVEKLVLDDLRGWARDASLTRQELERVEERLRGVEARWRKLRGVSGGE